MKWIGWIVAGLCAVGVIVMDQQGRARVAAHQQELEQRLADLADEAQERVDLNRTAVDERLKRLERERVKTAEMQATRDEARKKYDELHRSIRELVAKAQGLRSTGDSTVVVRDQSDQQAADLKERIRVAKERIEFWKKMLPMVSDTGEGN
jgi:chromosome segregation ATPase